jgi:glycine cleavage system H protein
MARHHKNALAYRRGRFATELPLDYRYSPTHFWIGQESGDTCRVGLTKFGSRLLGEVVDCGFEAPPGGSVIAGQVIGWVEGFKCILDVVVIGQGTFALVNPALETNITVINQDPYGAGWLYALEGKPDPACFSAYDYARVLDSVIDRWLGRC